MITKDQYRQINTLMDLWEKYEQGKLVEPVRCKDCVFQVGELEGGHYRCSEVIGLFEPEHFCSYGIRSII